jgi:hypothetical protein
MLRYVYDENLCEEALWDAEGWPHTHSGHLLTKRGLTPQIKEFILAKLRASRGKWRRPSLL